MMMFKEERVYRIWRTVGYFIGVVDVVST